MDSSIITKFRSVRKLNAFLAQYQQKYCGRCKSIKSYTEFHNCKSSRIHKKYYLCKMCASKVSKARGKVFRQRIDSRFKHSKSSAKYRQIEWNLMFEDYKNLVEDAKCHYCSTKKLPVAGIGLDRLNNNKGYELGNVVPCCALCNYVRHRHFSPEEMKRLGQQIALIREMRRRKNIEHINDFSKIRLF